jgi:ectoine hydroxylase-related dioxygenase (phytanoyl-CoA dioxygenase family)
MKGRFSVATTIDSLKMRKFLSQQELDFYHDEGYLVIPSVFSSEEIERLANDVDRVCEERKELIHTNNMRVRFKNHVSTSLPVFEVLDPISDLSTIAKQMTADERIVNRVSSIYGEAACLFKDKLIYKPPGADGATLHQDWIGWPGFPESFLTVLVAIDPFTVEGGATKVYPRLHKNGYLSAKDGSHHHLEHADMGTPAVPLILERGDIAIFSCFTPHYSEANLDSNWRRGYFISYNAISDGGPQFDRHYAEFHEWIRAKSPIDKRNQLTFE